MNSPKYLIAAHQTASRLNATNKILNIPRFDSLNVKKYFVEIDGYRYPRHSVLINYGADDYTDRYRDSKMFVEQYIGEQLLNTFISYPDMKTK